MKWLIRRIQKLFSGKPFILEGEKHWLSSQHYQQYKAFRNSLDKALRYYQANGVPGYTVHHEETETWLDLADKVKQYLEDRFIYTKDINSSGLVDNWEVPVLSDDGKLRDDCDGYAGFAMLLLLLEGVPRDNLRLALCLTNPDDPNTQHMVLILRTLDGDYVIDNINRIIWRWDRLYYKFHHMEDGTGSFVKIIN